MRNEFLRRLSVCAALCLSGATLPALCAFAAPAPWHQWSSRIDGSLTCAQTTPGPGWDHARGPFKDAGCRERLRPPREAATERPDGRLQPGALIQRPTLSTQ